MKTVLFSGGREWNNWDIVRRELKQLSPGTVLIHGTCRGLDTIADIIATNHLGMSVVRYPAKWDKYGKKAGILRNIQMLDQEPDEIYCFHTNIDNSKGTRHMIKEGTKRHIPVYLIRGDGEKALMNMLS